MNRFLYSSARPAVVQSWRYSAGRAVLVLTVLGAIGLLTLAVWPGLLENAVLAFPFGLLSLPLLGCWFLFLVGLALRDLVRQPVPTPNRRRWGLWSAGLMFAAIGLLWFHVPQRAVFAFCSSTLRGLVEIPATDKFRGENLGRRVGPYRIDRYGADRRGGVFFRTNTGPDGIGPDEMSYGFAFRPNVEGTPFGNARYRRRHLFGDWYAFAVSDDW